LPRNAKLRQDFFENLGNFSRGRWPRWITPAGLAFNDEEEEEEGLLPPALPEVPAYKK
jgi:hypothetical protein